MSILFVISQLPYPLDTGAKIRSFNLIKKAPLKHEIDLVAFGDEKKDREKIGILNEFCANVYVVPRKNIPLGFGILFNLFSKLPYNVQKYYSKEMENLIHKLTQKNNYNLIHCDSLQASYNVISIDNILKVLTEHNIESQIWKRASQNEKNIFKKVYLYLQYVKLRQYEISTCKRFDRVITVSDEDRNFIANYIPKERISVVPNGVDTEFFNTRYAVRGTQYEDAVVFTGSMDWLPNVDAVEYFCKEILPLIKKKKPNVKFYVVGRSPSLKLLKLADLDSNVIVAGRVDDVRPYIEKCKVFITPLRIGSGTRLKILEAFAMGKAVVSTSIGCEGLAVSHEKDIIVADTASGFAEEVIALLSNTRLRNKLGRSARQLSEDRYDWKVVADELEKTWQKGMRKTPIPVPVLLYHDICDNSFDIPRAKPENRPYILPKSEFERQMKYLYYNGYRTLSLYEFFNNQSPQSNKVVIIAFDDGHKSNCEKALPIMKTYNQKAVFFVTPNKVGEKDMMNWEEIEEIHKEGMEVGSHSLTHNIPVKLSEGELEHELKESKSILERKLSIQIDYFSSPTGFNNPLLPEAAKKAGYKAILISNPSLNGDDSFILNKTSVKRSYSFEKFVGIVNRDKSTFTRLNKQQSIRDSLKKILGPDVYNFVRNVALRGMR